MRSSHVLRPVFAHAIAALVLLGGALVPGSAGAGSFRAERDKEHRSIGVDVFEPADARKALGAAKGASGRLSRGFDTLMRTGKAMPSSQPMEHSVALDALARIAAHSHVNEIGTLTDDYYDWLMWRNGVVGSRFRWRWISSSKNLHGDNVLVGSSVFEPEGRGHVRYGVAQVNHPDEQLQMAVLVDSKIAFEELAKHHEPGTDATIRGRFLLDVEGPHLLIATDGPEVRRIDMELVEERAFVCPVPLASTPGRYLVEIRAKVLVGEAPDTTTVARFPLYVGVDEPTEPEPWRLGKVSGVSHRMEEWPETVLAVYNREREAHGLEPMVLDEAVSRLAHRWASLMVAGEVSGHPPNLTTALSEAEVSVSEVTPFNSKFYFPTARAETTVQSPYRRMTYVDPDARSIGIGIVQDKVVGGQQRYRMVELIVVP